MRGLQGGLEALASSQAQSSRAFAEMQEQTVQQQQMMMEQMAMDRTLARERAKQDAKAAERLQESNLEFQKQQMSAQSATNEVLLKVGKASGEHRTRVKKEIAPIRASRLSCCFSN